MTQQADYRISARSTAVFLAEAALLFVVLAVPYFLPDMEAGVPISRLIAVIYVLLTFEVAKRSVPGGSPSWLTVVGLATAHLICGTIVAVILWMSMIGGLAHWISRPVTAQPIGAAGPDPVTLVVMVLVPIALFTFGVWLALRRRGDGSGGVRRRSLPLRSPGTLLTLAAMLVLGGGLFGIWAPGMQGFDLSAIVDLMTRDRTTPLAWELAVAVPSVPIGLLAASVMLVVHRRMTPAILAIIESRPSDRAGFRGGLFGLALGCGVVVLGGAAHALHFKFAAGIG